MPFEYSCVPCFLCITTFFFIYHSDAVVQQDTHFSCTGNLSLLSHSQFYTKSLPSHLLWQKICFCDGIKQATEGAKIKKNISPALVFKERSDCSQPVVQTRMPSNQKPLWQPTSNVQRKIKVDILLSDTLLTSSNFLFTVLFKQKSSLHIFPRTFSIFSKIISGIHMNFQHPQCHLIGSSTA